MTKLERAGLLRLCEKWNRDAAAARAWARSHGPHGDVDRDDKNEQLNKADNLERCARDLFDLIRDQVEVEP